MNLKGTVWILIAFAICFGAVVQSLVYMDQPIPKIVLDFIEATPTIVEQTIEPTKPSALTNVQRYMHLKSKIWGSDHTKDKKYQLIDLLEEQYSDTTMMYIGALKDIDTAYSHKTFVHFQPIDFTGSLDCKHNKDETIPISMNKQGQLIRVTGTFDGDSFTYLKDCTYELLE